MSEDWPGADRRVGPRADAQYTFALSPRAAGCENAVVPSAPRLGGSPLSRGIGETALQPVRQDLLTAAVRSAARLRRRKYRGYRPSNYREPIEPNW